MLLLSFARREAAGQEAARGGAGVEAGKPRVPLSSSCLPSRHRSPPRPLFPRDPNGDERAANGGYNSSCFSVPRIHLAGGKPEGMAENLEERQTDWANSKPVVMLGVLWDLAFIVVTAAMLATSLSERPTVLLLIWLGGYVLQCLLHINCVTA